MNILVMDDYKHFVDSFINIEDEKIKEVVETEIKATNIRRDSYFGGFAASPFGKVGHGEFFSL